MKNKSFVRRLCRGALIGALYVILTMVSHMFGLDSGKLPFGIQCRISEALCILPLFAPEAVVGLTVGCLLSNLLVGINTGILWQDVIFGSLATLLGALGTLAFRRARGWVRYLASLPTVVANAIIVPLVLRYAYGYGDAWWIFVITVSIGELISATLLGSLLIPVVERTRIFARPDWSGLDK